MLDGIPRQTGCGPWTRRELEDPGGRFPLYEYQIPGNTSCQGACAAAAVLVAEVSYPSGPCTSTTYFEKAEDDHAKTGRVCGEEVDERRRKPGS